MEFSVALGIMYYHFVHPYMRATGIEGSQARLNQVQFMELNPLLVNELEAWAADPTHLSLKDRKGSFQNFPETLKVQEKDKKIYDYLFDEVLKKELVDVKVVLGLCSAMCHKFVTVFERQIGDLYLAGENSKVAKQIVKDPVGIKFASVNNLNCEHYFGSFRNLSDRFKGASIACISRRLLSCKSIFAKSLETMPVKVYQEKKEWFKSPMYEAFMKIKEQSKELEAQRKIAKVEKMRETKILVAKKALENVIKCQSYGGPFINTTEVTAVVKEYENDGGDRLKKILEAEICYQRDNVKLTVKEDGRYRFQKLTNAQKEKNLKSLLELGGNGPEAQIPRTFDMEQAFSSIEALSSSYCPIRD